MMNFIQPEPWAVIDKDGNLTKLDLEEARRIATKNGWLGEEPATTLARLALAVYAHARLEALNAAADKAFDIRNQFNARSHSWDDQKSGAVADNIGKEIQKLRGAK